MASVTRVGVVVGGPAGSGVYRLDPAIGPETQQLRKPWNGTPAIGGTRIYYQGIDSRLHSCELDGSDDKVVDTCPAGISFVVASATVWAAWTTGTVTATSWGGRYTGWVPMLATDDGAVLLMSYPDPGQGLRLVSAEGELWSDSSARGNFKYPYPQAFALDRHRFMWVEPNGVVRVHGLPEPMQPGRATFDPFLLEAPDGEYWFGDHDSRCQVHPLTDTSRGYILSTGKTFGTSAAGNRVGWGLNPGETELGFADVDWSAPTVSLLDEMPEVVVAPFSRPCWLMPFHATRHGQSVGSPGHAEIITDGQDARHRVMSRPVVADLQSEQFVDDLLALFVVIGRDRISDAREVADRRGVPIMAYWDHTSPVPNVPELIAGKDWVSVMLYCDPAESLAQFKARASGQVADASRLGFGVVLTVQMFDRNGTETDLVKMSAMQAVWRELAEAYPDVVGIAPFAVLRIERNAGGHVVAVRGVTGYPFLGQWLDAYGRAMVAPSRTPSQPPPPEIPEEIIAVTITNYTKTGVAPKEILVECVCQAAFSREGHLGCVLEVLVNGKPVEARPIGLTSGRPLAQAVRFTIDAAGIYDLTARLTSAQTVAETSQPRPIVIVAPAPTQPPPPAPPANPETEAQALIREAQTSMIRRAFQTAKQREPRADELDSFRARMNAGQLTSRDLLDAAAAAPD